MNFRGFHPHQPHPQGQYNQQQGGRGFQPLPPPSNNSNQPAFIFPTLSPSQPPQPSLPQFQFPKVQQPANQNQSYQPQGNRNFNNNYNRNNYNNNNRNNYQNNYQQQNNNYNNNQFNRKRNYNNNNYNNNYNNNKFRNKHQEEPTGSLFKLSFIEDPWACLENPNLNCQSNYNNTNDFFASNFPSNDGLPPNSESYAGGEGDQQQFDNGENRQDNVANEEEIDIADIVDDTTENATNENITTTNVSAVDSDIPQPAV